jgi:cell wall-associated NlpC family hydrolase
VAIRGARPVRPLIALIALGVACLVAPTFASATPQADRHHPTSVTSVQKRLGNLALKNSQLVEKYDRAQVAVQRDEKAAQAAEGVAARARTAYQAAHTRFAQIVQAQFESDSFGAAGALLDSSSGTNYVDRLNTLDMVSTQTAQVVSSVAQARSQADTAANRADSLLAAARGQRDALAKERDAVQTQIRKYQTLLATLTSAQQYAYQRLINPNLSSAQIAQIQVHATSAAAERAVRFALAQVGKPYVWGAAGPSSYDCSGLTMAAWAHGGVSLPHSAADQYNYGHHVSRNDLQPGDLIFFYQPIGHVTIYIGDGMMVSAPTEGQNVSVVPLSAFNSDYTGATRLT